MEDIKVEFVEGESKKTGNKYSAVKLTIGDWSTLVFPRSTFEMNYIKSILEE